MYKIRAIPFVRCKVRLCWRKARAFILRTCSLTENWGRNEGARKFSRAIFPRQKSIMHNLRSEIERYYATGSLPVEVAGQARKVFSEFRQALTHGEIRAAEKHDGHWRVNAWVKQGILLGFRLGELEEIHSGAFTFVDKDTFPARRFAVGERVRVVPGGSALRSGAYIAPGVICMPPMYVNVGAYVDEGTLIDSHALVGS